MVVISFLNEEPLEVNSLDVVYTNDPLGQSTKCSRVYILEWEQWYKTMRECSILKISILLL